MSRNSIYIRNLQVRHQIVYFLLSSHLVFLPHFLHSSIDASFSMVLKVLADTINNVVENENRALSSTPFENILSNNFLYYSSIQSELALSLVYQIDYWYFSSIFFYNLSNFHDFVRYLTHFADTFCIFSSISPHFFSSFQIFTRILKA